MYFWLGVKNFAKIESAKIRTDGLTVLVGPNNCGKTFLMQLVQGVGESIYRMLDDDVVQCLFRENEKSEKYVISSKNLEIITNKINEKLKKKKNEIVKNIFKREIPIEELFIDIEIEKDCIYEIFLQDEDRRDLIDKNLNILNPFREIITHMYEDGKDFLLAVVLRRNIVTEEYDFVSLHVSSRDYFKLYYTLSDLLECESLYLPPSRNGLLLMYRDFFANRTDDAIASYKLKNNMLVDTFGKRAGITQPVYEFLRFLQTYTEADETKAINTDEIDFFNKNLLEGHISVNDQGVFSYQSEHENELVPMYVASSMINEMAPLILTLTSERRFERLIIDEVETSLHPSKQQELMRFFSRLNRKGLKLILSTHSDTFVSKLNNLYVLSNYIVQNQNKEILSKLDLNEDDLMKLEDLSVYEFIDQGNGKYQAIEVFGDPQMGYQFDLFTNSAMKLYEEASQLGDAVEHDSNRFERT